MAGRKPLPTQLKIIKGTVQKCRMRKEPKPPTAIPDAPKCLDSIGKREWKRITAELGRLGLVTALDMAALAGYCQAYSNWYQAAKELKAEKRLTTLTANGTLVQHPLVGIVNTSAAEMRRFLVEFGMTPSSRARVNVGESEGKGSGFAGLPGGAKTG